jgi:predicted permease
MKKTKQATTSSAVLSVFASKSLCCMPFCGYILYLSDGSPSQQKNQSKSKIKKVNQKLSQQPKLPKVCSSYLM